MSIIVKGIKMPKEGCFNILYVYGDGSIRMPVWGKGLVKAEYMQASELPPHGRLIDADSLTDNCMKEDGFLAEMLFRKVSNAPTIIEAEEAEQ